MNPPIESPFAGSWSGVATLEGCTGESGSDPTCADGTSRSAFRSTLTFDPQTNTYTGVVSTWFIFFTIGGKVEPDGTLVMTGDGTNSVTHFGATATEWRLRTDGTALTGTFRYRNLFNNVIYSVRLEYVSLNGTLPIPGDARFGVSVNLTRVRRPEGLPVYEICVSFTNASPITAHVVSGTVTPITANGAEYAVDLLYSDTGTIQPFASRLGANCFIGRDQLSRPLASSLRLRLELAYDDQVTGRLEVTRPITAFE
jgi:hypothetical protein